MEDLNRRRVLGGMALGAALVASGTAAASVENAATKNAFKGGDGDAPWWMLSPLAPGAALARGWRVSSLSAVRKGASVLTLVHDTKGPIEVHLCAHDGSPRGVASTEFVDLIIMDGGHGTAPTDEELGRLVMDLAAKIRENEMDENGDLRPISRMLPHDTRLDAYGPEESI